jgi:Adenylate cyclase, family 3 (some proteins contain HAMP domain)
LSKELDNVAALSIEKQQLLESQNEKLEVQVAERTKELQQEKQKSDNLLLNILPQEVAEELKEKGASKAQYYDEVSVLFTDFVNFTATAEQLGVDELLAELNVNFTAFDQIMEKHGLEKLRPLAMPTWR